jgi:hypothetical protein
MGRNIPHSSPRFWSGAISARTKNDPKHWRDRAAQMRALALTMKDSEAAILMNDLAADYETLADIVALKLDGSTPPKGKPK